MQPRTSNLSNRRSFLQRLGVLVAGSQALLRSPRARADEPATPPATPDWPAMPYRTLGRTGFRASRLIFGCGATLYSDRADALLETAYESGINVFDVGYSGYYNKAEVHLAPFLKRHRDDVFLISKAEVDLEADPDESIPPPRAHEAARLWSERLDGSLRELGVEQVDAYYLMAAYNPSIVASDELHRAFERAKQAGKVRFFGLSTHQNADRVLEAAIETGAYDLAMLGVTPAGWYEASNWTKRGIRPGSQTLAELQPLLARARAAGMGLIGMKAGRFLDDRGFFTRNRDKAFEAHYGPSLRAAPLSPFQKSYAFVLQSGLDAVNADMQSLAHLHANFVAAATSSQYLA